MHTWGDHWPHWPELYKAEVYINKMYERITGERISTKEKWGSIRYETNIEDGWKSLVFRKIIWKTVRKFPKVAAEVASNASFVVSDSVYFEGWCAGVAMVKGGGWWRNGQGIVGFT